MCQYLLSAGLRVPTLDFTRTLKVGLTVPASALVHSFRVLLTVPADSFAPGFEVGLPVVTRACFAPGFVPVPSPGVPMKLRKRLDLAAFRALFARRLAHSRGFLSVRPRDYGAPAPPGPF
jgi:hypothetical protein